MTNKEKFIEIMNSTFDAGLTEENIISRCSPCGLMKFGACRLFSCDKCESWWDKEYICKSKEGE